MDEASKRFLERYLATLSAPPSADQVQMSAGYFCADQHNADICAELILKGEKRATCSMDYWYSHEGEPIPAAGDLHVVTRWDGQPVCIIEVTEVSKCRYADVDEDFAAAEGEGDKSLGWWRQAHWEYFSRECAELGLIPREDILLILEQFKVVFIAPP